MSLTLETADSDPEQFLIRELKALVDDDTSTTHVAADELALLYCYKHGVQAVKSVHALTGRKNIVRLEEFMKLHNSDFEFIPQSGEFRVVADKDNDWTTVGSSTLISEIDYLGRMNNLF